MLYDTASLSASRASQAGRQACRASQAGRQACKEWGSSRASVDPCITQIPAGQCPLRDKHEHMRAHTHARTRTCTHARAHTHARTRTCTHARAHIHTHTYTHRNARTHTHTHALQCVTHASLPCALSSMLHTQAAQCTQAIQHPRTQATQRPQPGAAARHLAAAAGTPTSLWWRPPPLGYFQRPPHCPDLTPVLHSRERRGGEHGVWHGGGDCKIPRLLKSPHPSPDRCVPSRSWLMHPPQQPHTTRDGTYTPSDSHTSTHAHHK